MIANSASIDTSYLDEAPRAGRAGGYIAAALAGAAVGAGVALLLAPEKGVKTRRKVNRWVDALEVGARLGLLQAAASKGARAGVDYVGRRMGRTPPRRSRARTFGLVGTLAGIGIATLLAPEGGRERVSRVARSASDRFGDFRRARRNGGAGTSSFDRVGTSSFDDPLAEPRTPVRSVQETAQDETKAF
jgi:gas vesicle protein